MAGSNPGGGSGGAPTLPPRLQPFMTTAVVLAGLGLVLALFAWTRPATTTSSKDIESTREAVFAYTAPVPPTPAYEGTEVVAPDPVFRKVTNTVTVAYDYTGPAAGGTARFDAILSTSGGWRWTLPLASEIAFDTSTHRGTASLDLNSIEARAKAGSEAAGIPSGGDVTVTLAPTITTANGDFTPELPLSLTTTSLTVADTEDLKVSEPITTTVPTEEPNELSFLSFSIPVSTARLWSVILLAVGLIGAAAIAVLAAKGPAPTEDEIIRRRYKDLVVPVTEVPAPVGAVINVPDIATLAKLAKRYALLILHGVQDGRDVYLIQDESTTYRYLGEQHAAQFLPQGGPPSGGDHEGLGDADASAPADAPSTLLVGTPPSAAPPTPRRPSRKSRRRPGKSPKNTHPAGPPLHGGGPTDAPPQSPPMGAPASGPPGQPTYGDPQAPPPGPPPHGDPQFPPGPPPYGDPQSPPQSPPQGPPPFSGPQPPPPGPPPVGQPSDQHPPGPDTSTAAPSLPAPRTNSRPVPGSDAGSPDGAPVPQAPPSWPPPPPGTAPTTGRQPEQAPQP